MLLGLRTSIHPVADLDAAKAWFTALLGAPPTFDEPFYVGYEVGGYELGLLPGGQGEVQTYWGVPDADAAWAALLERGATAHTPVAEVGGGIKTALVTTPLGTLLGIIENPHFRSA